MKTRSFILRCATFILILVFSQKTGAGLLLHNLLHTTQAKGDLPAKQSDGKEIGFACKCIDDFLMPFTGAAEPVVVLAINKHIAEPVFLQFRIPFRAPVFSSLRGPPAVV